MNEVQKLLVEACGLLLSVGWTKGAFARKNDELLGKVSYATQNDWEDREGNPAIPDCFCALGALRQARINNRKDDKIRFIHSDAQSFLFNATNKLKEMEVVEFNDNANSVDEVIQAFGLAYDLAKNHQS